MVGVAGRGKSIDGIDTLAGQFSKELTKARAFSADDSDVAGTYLAEIKDVRF